MKKHQSKNNKNNKTKIQLKIKSKNVTNNFILTPRALSPRDYKDTLEKKERFVQDTRSDKLKLQQLVSQKQQKESKKTEYRMITTDHTKGNIKKRCEDQQTGTQTPLVKRLSETAQYINKKKSSHSLNSTQRGLRKKNSDRFSKVQSGELSKTMFSRVLGIILKDFQEGKLKYKQLQQTLIELYDRTQRKKSMNKKHKKKDYGYSTFSNQFLRSSQQQGRSQIIFKKFKQNEDDLQISQRVLEKQGFVNRIIVKGITTSTFLKEDIDGSNLRQKQMKQTNKQPSFNIHTSNSIKEINQQMRLIQQKFKVFSEDKSSSLQDVMATKIQRAWRRYRTKKLLKKINSHENNFNINDILDDFTDQEQNAIEQIYQTKETKTVKPENSAEIQYNQLVKLVSQSLKSNKVSKQQCLKNILSYLKIPNNLLSASQSIKIEGQSNSLNLQQNIEPKMQFQNQLMQQHSLQMSRVKLLEIPFSVNQIEQKQLNQQNLQNEDEINSFTNKYSSKEVDNTDYFKDNKSITQESSEIDKSLIFTHSQTMATENFKMINIKNIEEGLKSREEVINIKKQKQIQQLTQKLFCNKINKDQYRSEKQKIDKWFKTQQKQLKKVKNSLLKSCNEARKILQNVQTELKSQKSRKMLKCLSDKYIKKNNWSTNINTTLDKKQIISIKKLKCQQQEDQLRSTQIGLINIDKSNHQNEETGDYLIFNKKDSIQTQQQTKIFEITPKLFRSISIQEQSNDYNYEQIQKAIDQDEDGIEEGLIKYQKKIQLQSDKFIVSEQQCQDLIQEHELSLLNNLVNQQKKRFKYLCTEDKQDIFEFLFLDLVLQMFNESISDHNKILRCAQIYISKTKRLKKIPKGIKTNLAASKEYLKVLSKYVLSHQYALKNLSIPMGPSAIQLLKYMRDEFTEADDQESISSTLVIPLEIFQKVSRLPQLELKLQRYYDDQEKELGRLSFLRTALNINNKSLFDSLNEMLDHQRPYGVWGKPFPWKKMLSLDRQWSKSDQENKMKKCIDKTIQSCSYLCGIIVDKEDSLFGSHRVSEQYVMQIRQDRLSKMLANELLENQERWIFYDDEETQILMEVSSFITKKLIKELVLQIVSLRMKF